MPPERVANTSFNLESDSGYLLSNPTAKVTIKEAEIDINLYHSGIKFTRMKTRAM